jgi:hypothetical protein
MALMINSEGKVRGFDRYGKERDRSENGVVEVSTIYEFCCHI